MSTFVASLLASFTFWLQITLGGLGILLIHDVVGGRWGLATHPFLRAILPTLYVLGAAFIPIAIFAPTPFFLIRGIIYFGIWLAIARGFQKRKTSGRPTKAWSGGSLLVLLFSVSFAAMDWLMRLDPHWASTGFGVIFIAGSIAAGFAFITAMAVLLRKHEETIYGRDLLLIDLGNLLLMAALFWAYVDFAQYLIIWSGQIPRETHWFFARSKDAWPWMIALTAFLGLALPLSTLIFRRFKRSPRSMLLLTLAILIARFLESQIWVAPSHKIAVLPALGIGLITLALVGFPWLFVYRSSLRGRMPVPEQNVATSEVRS